VTPAASSVNEGSSLNFTVGGTNIVNGTYYWNVESNAGDFGTSSGSFTITSNSGSFTVTPTADFTTESTETFTVTIRSGSASGSILATSSSVIINDTSLTASYTVTPAASNVNEGSSLTFNVTGANIVNNTYYWTVNSNAGDFGTSSGSFNIASNSGSFLVTPTADLTTEGAESFTVSIRSGSTSGSILATSSSVTINDTSQAPTYSVTPAASSVNEGSSLTFNVSGTNITNGTYYWTIENQTSSAGDFGTTSGSFTITSNSGSFSVTPTADLTTESAESFTVSIRSGSTSGTVLATSSSVTINDTSTTPAPTYSVAPAASNVNEGSSLTFNVSGTYIVNGTYYWTVNSNAGDFGTSSGSFTITSNSGSFSVTPTADLTTEGAESFTVSIRSGSISGSILATSSSVTINDTSLTPPPTYEFSSSNPTSLNENTLRSFSVDTTRVSNGTTLYWTIGHGTTVAADFSADSGSFTINSNTGSFSIFVSDDYATEGAQTFNIAIRTGSITGTPVASTGTITINDTSVPTYSVTPAASSVNEGSSLTFNVSGNGIPNGTYYWRYEANTADGADVSLQGSSFTINNNSGSFNVTATADLTTEGSQTFAVTVRSGNVNGTLLATSSLVTIIDTSTTPVPTYTVTPAASNVNEGGSLTFTIGGTNIVNGTYYWSIYNITTQSNDFSVVSAAVQITNNSGSFTVGPISDATTEGAQTFQVYLYDGFLNLLANSSTVTINDTSQTPVPTYSLTPAATSVNEGSSLNFTVGGTNIVNGIYYWIVTHNYTEQADFSSGVTYGSVIITNNTGAFSVTAAADLKTEGAESFTVDLFSDASYNVFLASSGLITINDTSTSPPPEYSITPAATSVDEGSSLTFTVTAKNVANPNASLYWILGNFAGGTASADFTGALYGTLAMSNGTGTVTITAKADFLDEGAQTFKVTIKPSSTSTTILATSSEITINDTSVPTYSLNPVAATVNEGSGVKFNVTGNGITSGTYYWAIEPSTAVANDFNSASGTFSVSSNAGNFTVTPKADTTTEGQESFTVTMRSGSATGTILATSSVVVIADTSLNPPTYAWNLYPTSLDEPSTHNYGVTTTSVPNGTTLYWAVTHGSTSAADFVSSVVNGSFTINNNEGLFGIQILADSLTEGAQTFQMTLRSGSVTGSLLIPLVNCPTITINDKSTAPLPLPGITVSGTTSSNEGTTLTFNVTTTGMANGSTGYWWVYKLDTGISGNDLVDGNNTGPGGNFTINNNSGSFTITSIADLRTEGTETYNVYVQATNAQGTTTVTTLRTLFDTSISPTLSISGPTSVSEGVSSTYTVTANNRGMTIGFVQTEVLTWTINHGTTTAADFAATTGTTTPLNGLLQGTFTITPVSDADAGNETFTISINPGLNQYGGYNEAAVTTPTITIAGLPPPAFALISYNVNLPPPLTETNGARNTYYYRTFTFTEVNVGGYTLNATLTATGTYGPSYDISSDNVNWGKTCSWTVAGGAGTGTFTLYCRGLSANAAVSSNSHKMGVVTFTVPGNQYNISNVFPTGFAITTK
jgi:hypothetical protein